MKLNKQIEKILKEFWNEAQKEKDCDRLGGSPVYKIKQLILKEIMKNAPTKKLFYASNRIITEDLTTPEGALEEMRQSDIETKWGGIVVEAYNEAIDQYTKAIEEVLK